MNLKDYIDFNKLSVLNADPSTFAKSVLEGRGILKSSEEVSAVLMLFGCSIYLDCDCTRWIINCLSLSPFARQSKFAVFA